MVVRKPAHRFLDELEIEYDDYVVIKHPALFTSTGVTGEEHRDDREHAGDEGNGHERPAEDAIVKLTREIVPGMIVTGMEVSEMDGSLRMGQTSISGQKAAHLALRALGLPNSLGEQVKSGSTGIHSVSINWEYPYEISGAFLS